MTDYDLNEIADKLAQQASVNSWQINGQTRKVTGYSEDSGTVSVPAVVVELDSVSYDVSIGRGADSFVFLLHLIVDNADSASGQRLTRQLLSSGSGITSVKDALEANGTLGGLVSYANITGTRTIGSVTYGGIDYLGATLEVEVMS